jgi:predicted transcriptional regulator
MGKPEPDLFDEVDDVFEAAADAEAEADVSSGRLIPHEEVSAWLDTWGTPNEKPAPKTWFNK